MPGWWVGSGRSDPCFVPPPPCLLQADLQAAEESGAGPAAGGGVDVSRHGWSRGAGVC